jgi:formylmethanofuran dehydrogenase subunit C
VSESITLTLRAPLDAPLRVEVIQPARLSELPEREIAELPLTLGREHVALGELFAISGERSSRVIVAGGSTRRLNGLGAGMSGGELVIDGDAGDDAGMAMSGGLLRIQGNVGDRLGGSLPGAAKGMTGGEILVRGSAGNEAGVRARRGLIVVGGSTGDDAGRAMIAGTLVVLGACGAHPGRGSKRGSIIACGSMTVPPTYRYACTFEPPHVKLTLTYLNRRHGLGVSEEIVNGRYRRYCGDAGDPGKGEILLIDLMRCPTCE